MENVELLQQPSPGVSSILHSPFSILHSSPGGTPILHSSFSILNSSGGCSFVGFGDYVIFTCGESCDCGGCEAVGSYTYENVYIPVSGGPCGCTPHDDPPEDPEDPPSGGGGDPPDPPPPVPSVTVSFSTPVVIFENRYENSPGSWVEKRSTQTTLTISAQGGEHGATLSISTQGLNKLAPVGTNASAPPSSVSLGAYESVTYTFTYEGVAASGSTEDVEVTGSILGNGASAPSSSSAKLTVVEIGVKAQKSTPLPVSRHSFGVCEVVKASWEPSSVSISWTSTGSGSWMRTLSAFREYQCPAQAESFLFTASYNGVTLDIPLTCIAPSQVMAEILNCVVEPSMTGNGGGIGMELVMILLPTNVCFANIEVVEVPSMEGSHNGYFSDSAWSNQWYHTTGNGAGEWTEVADDNSCGSDYAGIGLCSPPWSSGFITWIIPNAWRPCGGGEQDVHVFVTSLQNFQITVDGTVTVSKLGNSVTRTTNDVITSTGVLAQ